MICDKIRTLRDTCGLSQSALAKKIGVTRSAVNAWEMGLSIPTAQYIVAMAQLFHISTDYLLGLQNSQAIYLDGLTEQEKQEGILYKAESEAEDIAVIINYSVIGNGTEEDLLTNEEVAENFQRAGYREVKQVVINGITSVTCSIPDEDISLTAFLNEEGNRLYMVMINTDEETSMHYIEPILHSVKKV